MQNSQKIGSILSKLWSQSELVNQSPFLQNSQILCKNHEKLEIILLSISVDVLGLTFCTVIVYYVIYDVSYETGLLIAYFAIWGFILGG